MSDGVKPTRIEPEGYALPDEVSIDGDYTGDDVDWDSSPGVLGFDQWKQPVRAATTASVTIATALNAGDTLDGVTLAAGDRVLVKNQGTASQNGIYVVGATPARADDMDEDAEVLGAVVYVIDGTANAATLWTVTNIAATVVDTDDIDWAQVSGGSGITVEDEGSPLSTLATTLDFVGAGVTATGSGSTKTITIPGGGSSPFYDVRTYGAVCDNTTDDNVALQDTLDAIAAAGGGTMFVPGPCANSATLTYTGSGLHVLGGGSRYAPGMIRMTASNTTCFLFAPSSGTIERVKGPKFENVVIAGPGSASSGYGIDARNDIHMESCFVYGFYDGVHLSTASYYSVIRNCTFTDCDRAGVYLDSCNNTTIDTCRFTGLFSGGSAPIGALAYGVYIYSPSAYGLNHRIVNSSIEYFTADGVYLDGGRAVLIEGNYFESQQSGSGNAEVLVGPNSGRVVAGLRIASNYFQGDGTSGFHAVKSTYLAGLVLESNYRGINAAIPYTLDASNTTNVLILNDTESPAATDTYPASTYTLNPAAPPLTSGDAAGGDLAGNYPNPTVQDDSHSHTAATLPAVAATSSGGDHEHMVEAFNGDASTTSFEIADEPVDPDQVMAWVGGSLTAITVSGAMSTTITFGSAPGSGTGNVVIAYPAAVA